MPRVLIKRGTYAQLEQAAAWGQLAAGELFLITDQFTLAFAIGAFTFVKVADLLNPQTLPGKTLTAATLVNPVITGAIKEDVYTITDSAAFEIDPGNGSIQLVTLNGMRTPKATNFEAGESVTLMIDDQNLYLVVWTDTTFGSSGVKWVNNSAPVFPDGSNYTVVELWKVGSQVYGAWVGGV